MFRIINLQFIANNMKIIVGYKIVILLLLLHECETRCQIRKGEHSLIMNEKIVLSKINVFVHKSENVISV
jgi:hypothetical protein